MASAPGQFSPATATPHQPSSKQNQRPSHPACKPTSRPPRPPSPPPTPPPAAPYEALEEAALRASGPQITSPQPPAWAWQAWHPLACAQRSGDSLDTLGFIPHGRHSPPELGRLGRLAAETSPGTGGVAAAPLATAGNTTESKGQAKKPSGPELQRAPWRGSGRPGSQCQHRAADGRELWNE